MLGHTFTHKETQLKQLTHKQLPEKIHFATLTHDKQINPVHFLVKLETVFPSQPDDCHRILADSRIAQFSIIIIDKRENIRTKPIDSLSSEAVKPFQSQSKKPVKKKTKSLLQQ